MNPEAAMDTFRLDPGTSIAQAGPQAAQTITLDSPAISVMRDLTRVQAATTSAGTGLREAEQMMINQGVRMLFVLNGLPAIEGLITSNDVSGDKPMRVVHERNVHFEELTVADVMSPLAELDAIDIEQMDVARVGNLVATLKHQGRNHLLVAARAADGKTALIRGVISRAEIARQLGSPIDITDIANSFSEIERALV